MMDDSDAKPLPDSDFLLKNAAEMVGKGVPCRDFDITVRLMTPDGVLDERMRVFIAWHPIIADDLRAEAQRSHKRILEMREQAREDKE